MTRVSLAACVAVLAVAAFSAPGGATTGAAAPELEALRGFDGPLFQRNPYPSDPCQRVPPPRACG